MDEALLTRLEGLIKTLDEQVSKEEFVKTLELVLQLIIKIEKKSADAVSSLEQTYDHLLRYAKEDHSTSLADLKSQVDQLFVANRLADIEKALTGKIDAKLAVVRDGKDGKDGKAGAPGRPGRDGQDAVITPELRAELDALQEAIEKIRARPIGTVGGGVTNMRVAQAFKYILKTEQPTGDIDGVNATYTTTQPIFAVLAMSINGETIAQLPNYTIKGKSITFSSPLPADYSGKDFEIKYI